MVVIIFSIVTLVSCAVLAGWSFWLLKNYFKVKDNLIEGERSLYFYLVVSILGMILSVVLLVGWLLQ